MSLPEFNQSGELPARVHKGSGDEFIDRICSKGERRNFEAALSDTLDFAKPSNASFVFVGGPFVTNQENPEYIQAIGFTC